MVSNALTWCDNDVMIVLRPCWLFPRRQTCSLHYEPINGTHSTFTKWDYVPRNQIQAIISLTVFVIMKASWHLWWRHEMGTFSALLAICAGNSPVNGEFPTQRPVTRSFDVFFDLRVNKPLNKQPWAWWFETRSRSLWRHCNETFSVLQTLCEGNHWWPVDSPNKAI